MLSRSRDRGFYDPLSEMDRLDLPAYRAMSTSSRLLASSLTLETWVENFERGAARLRRMRDGAA